MKLLLDTHLLLWAAQGIEFLPPEAQSLMAAPENELLFSPASLWEIVIKNSLGRADFKVDPAALRRGLLDAGYQELSVAGAHALAVADLPLLHKDPFDRILLAQAKTEGLTLLTFDAVLAEYARPVLLIRN